MPEPGPWYHLFFSALPAVNALPNQVNGNPDNRESIEPH